MTLADNQYAPRFYGVETLEKGRNNTIKAPIYFGGALAAPTSGTVTVYSSTRVAVVDAAAVTISASIAQYTVTSAMLADYGYSDAWQIEWALLMGDSQTHTFVAEAALVRRNLYPVISDLDLTKYHSDLLNKLPPTESSYQDYITEAWAVIESMLWQGGRRPWLILSNHALREPHIYKTLELIALDFGSRQSDNSYWMEVADKYASKFDSAWARISFTEVSSEDGIAEDVKKSVAPTLWAQGKKARGSRGYSYPL